MNVPSSSSAAVNILTRNAILAQPSPNSSVSRRRLTHKHATLDQDAALVETHKADAFFSYKHLRAYQPLNTYWAEHDLMLHSEFRDGNVPAGFEQLRVLQDALVLLPDDVQTVSLHSDSAGYQIELLKYCAEGKNERFGVIEFTVSADVNAEFRRAALAADAVWKPLKIASREYEANTEPLAPRYGRGVHEIEAGCLANPG
jgi:hypothetical protein